MRIAISQVKSSSKAEIAKKHQHLVFGRTFSDRMFQCEWNPDLGWHQPRIVAHQPLAIAPSANVLHYAQQVFEGLKAHRRVDGSIALFRADKHAERLDRSADRLCMPAVGPELFLEAVHTLVDLDRDWVPPVGAGSLYIRPTIIATEAALGVRVASNYLFFVIAGPVGPYFPKGFKPVKIFVEQQYVRAVPGSIGFAKSAGNYAASLLPGRNAYANGCDQVLFLDARERRYLEELGGMNIFAVIDDTLVTPALSGSILPGITRDSILQIAASMGLHTEERLVSLDEIVKGIEQGDVTEIFAAGTAAVVTPIGSLMVNGTTVEVNHGRVGQLTQTFYDHLTGIHQGTLSDDFLWMTTVASKAKTGKVPAKAKRTNVRARKRPAKAQVKAPAKKIRPKQATRR